METASQVSYSRQKHIHFWRGQVWGRRGRLLKDATLWSSSVIGCLIALLFYHLPGGSLEIKDVGAAGLSFASIAFGACVTAIVLSLSLPYLERVHDWSTSGAQGSEFSHFSDLIFVLAWSAVAQLAVIMISLGAYLFCADLPMAPDHPRLSHTAALCACMAVGAYAFLQLFTVISTMSQIAYVTIDEENKKRRD